MPYGSPQSPGGSHSQWVAFYNGVGSHIECGNLPPAAEPPAELAKVERDKIIVRSYIGGLVKAFERRAA